MGIRYKGIIFDMDGTLTLPTIDFESLRREIGTRKGDDILKSMESMTEDEKRKTLEAIERYEAEVRASTRPRPGAKEALVKFKAAGAKLGIITRNTRKSLEDFLAKFGLDFDCALTREFPAVKPSPEPALHMLREWGIAPSEALLVGDYKFDIECGRAAGSDTCFLHNEGHESFAELADYSIKAFAELEGIVLPD